MEAYESVRLWFGRWFPTEAWNSKDNQIADLNLSDAYLEEDTQRRAFTARIAITLSIIFVPAGFFLDYFVYPERIKELLLVRVIASACLCLLLFALRGNRQRSQVVALGIATALANNIAFCWMIYILEGAVSPYYAGINLILLGMSVLLPWTLRETFWVCLTSIALYAMACLIEGNLFDQGAFSIFLQQHLLPGGYLRNLRDLRARAVPRTL